MEFLEKKVIRNFLNKFPKEKEQKVLKAILILGIDFISRLIPDDKLNLKDLKQHASIDDI